MLSVEERKNRDAARKREKRRLHGDEVRVKARVRWSRNKIKHSINNKKRYREDEDYRFQVLAKRKKYREDNPEKVKASTKKWFDENPEYVKDYRRKHWLIVKDRDRHKRQAYSNNRRATDMNFRLRGSLTSRVGAAARRKNASKCASTMELIGCSIQYLRSHLESQFQPLMSWDNYGKKGWEIDHREALAHFDLTKPDQQRIAFHYTNLQPLWGKDNLKKGAKR